MVIPLLMEHFATQWNPLERIASDSVQL